MSTKFLEKVKEKNIEKIQNENIDVLPSLPVLDEAVHDKLRDKKTICKRAIASLIAIQVALDIDAGDNVDKSIEFFSKIADKYEVTEYFSEKEKRIFKKEYTRQDVIDVSWNYETYWALIWALGLIQNDVCEKPYQVCDCLLSIDIVAQHDTYNDFENSCHLRTREEILEMLDLFYRYDWVCVERNLYPNTNIGKLKPSVVKERRKGLEWLFEEQEYDWDDISLDT